MRSKSSIPDFPEFIALDDITRAEYHGLVHKFGSYSDFGYTSLYVWARDHQHMVSKLGDNIVLSMHDYQDGSKFLTIIGDDKPTESTLRLFAHIKSSKEYSSSLHLIPHEFATQLDPIKFSVYEDRDNFDYILNTEKFVDLVGHDFSHLRRKLSTFSRFASNAMVSVIDLNNPMRKKEILELSYKWAFMGTEGSKTAHEEIAAIDKMLLNVNELYEDSAIHALGLFSDTKMIGFCIYEICDDYGIVHFIKADLDIPGSSDYMMVATMRELFNTHKIMRVNHEQDLGILGLRAAKERYCPELYLKKYTVEIK